MNSQDAELIRTIRREFGKRPVDITRTDIQVTNGRVSLGGQIAHLRDQPLVDLRDELNIIERILTRHPLVKNLAVSIRLMQPEVKDDQEGGPRGRMRQHH